MKTIIAAYCYKGKKDKHKILLVTSSAGHWIIPKGQVEKSMKKQDVALKEAWEEAGVRGKITGKGRVFRIRIGGLARWWIYPVKIHGIEDKWPEMGLRKRCFVGVDDAVKLIENKELREAVRTFFL